MSSICLLCNRSFLNDGALQQHLQHSRVHAKTFDCYDCDRSFYSEEALEKHLQNSRAHVESFDCNDCDRPFYSEEAFKNHLQSSRAHAKTFDCYDCDRPFYSKEALEKHLQSSRAHAKTFDCYDCDRSFYSEEALEKHLQNSRAHAETFDCNECDRSFYSKEALERRLQHSTAHHQAPGTPLDAFFRSFPIFEYDPSQPPATSYACLQAHMGWRRREAASADAWNRYQKALKDELRLWFGEEDDITAWHALCHAIGVEPPPKTCHGCEQAVRNTHVNIVDLIEWGRSHESNKTRVQTFRDIEELREYTIETGKIFQNTVGQADSNVVLRHLLRRIFREKVMRG